MSIDRVLLPGHMPTKTRPSGSDIEFAAVSLRQGVLPKKSEFALKATFFSFSAAIAKDHPPGWLVNGYNASALNRAIAPFFKLWR